MVATPLCLRIRRKIYFRRILYLVRRGFKDGEGAREEIYKNLKAIMESEKDAYAKAYSEAYKQAFDEGFQKGVDATLRSHIRDASDGESDPQGSRSRLAQKDVARIGQDGFILFSSQCLTIFFQ